MKKSIDEKLKRRSPTYEADSGPLTASQIRQIRKLAPEGEKHSVRSSLIEFRKDFRQ